MEVHQHHAPLSQPPVTDDGVAVEDAVVERPTHERRLITVRRPAVNVVRGDDAVITLADLNDVPRQAGRLAGDQVGLAGLRRCVWMAMDYSNDIALVFGGCIILGG